MDFIKLHFEAFLTFIITAMSFLGVIYAKFARLDRLELRLDNLEQNIKDNLIARLDRIETKIDTFLTKQ